MTRGPDGKPWHSWRVLLLPYLEERRLYDRYRFSEPWDGPHNRRLAAEFPTLRIYRCPSESPDGTSCSYFAIVGDRTMWPPDGATWNPEDAPDGLSKTLQLVEVSDSGVHWMEPRDLRFDAMTFRVNAGQGVGIRSRHGDLANAAFADTSSVTLMSRNEL